MRCEVQQTTRGTGRCKMQVAGPGRKYCRYHDPELKPATMAEAKRRIRAYWERRRAEGALSARNL
jgi:hypothetical protein